jgi:hypothetical protein
MIGTCTPRQRREAMDRVLEEHFRSEAEGDVPGILATYTPDLAHDVVGEALGTLRDQHAIGEQYAHLFSNVKGEAFGVKHRLYGDTNSSLGPSWSSSSRATLCVRFSLKPQSC